MPTDNCLTKYITNSLQILNNFFISLNTYDTWMEQPSNSVTWTTQWPNSKQIWVIDYQKYWKLLWTLSEIGVNGDLLGNLHLVAKLKISQNAA
jgi:hypothetical protein